ncbi:MAG TPA: helicase-related protein, partial [Euzebya sp.]|nr:helicase-related protein [Euzebya sp.]
QVVVAPRVLDEGVDVPDAELAVVLAAFRTRRQMIQRLGRVLRLKADGRAARLIVVFAIDTREDPAMGAQEDFLAEVTGVARSVVIRRF